MNILSVTSVLSVLSVLTQLSFADTPKATVRDLQDAFANTASKAKPSVVHITTVHEEVIKLPQFFFGDPDDFFQEFFQGDPRPRQPRTQKFETHGAGSGFIFDPTGYVLTNEHVVRGADQIKVILTQGNGREKSYPGRVIGKDPYLDLAVVKIDAAGPFPALELGDSSKVRVGDWAMAIGSPFALGQTVTVGVISAVRQTMIIEGRHYNDLLQTDAAINRGNSGGPLLDIDGRVIGINSAIYSPSGVFAGIGFAIPSNEAKDALELMRSGRPSTHGFLGIEVAPIDEIIQRQFNLPGSEGALVNRVIPRGPADKAGMRRGDVVRRLGSEPVDSPEDLMRVTSRAKPGDKLEAQVIREGKTKNLSLKVGERPETAAVPSKVRPDEEEPELPSGAFRWQGVTFMEAEGKVVVEEVAADSKLFNYLLPKDQLEGVNQEEVRDLAGLQRALERTKLSDGAVFDLVRGGQPMYISVQSK